MIQYVQANIRNRVRTIERCTSYNSLLRRELNSIITDDDVVRLDIAGVANET